MTGDPPTLPLAPVASAPSTAAPEPAVTLTARVFELPFDDGRPKLPASLQVSIVTFRPDLRLLERCLRKLVLAIGAAREDAVVRTVALALIDNSGDRAIAKEAIKLAQGRFKDANVQMTFLHGHANIGYGAAHNLVLHGSGADYHLVLNPDVELAPDALAVGAMYECQRRKLDVPGDVAIAGFDDIPLAAQVVPSLTTVQIRRYAIGERAGKLIADRLAGRPIRRRIVDTGYKLVTRESA